MKDFGLVYGTVVPDNLRVDAYNVFVCSDISEIGAGDELQYAYHLMQYDKDEYICILAAQNAMLEQQLVDTQLALCELYEGMEL